MKIKTLSLQNFMGYQQRVEVDFTGRGVVGIVGGNEAGKSSILEAIKFALYGKSRANREVDLINSQAEGPMVVELVVSLGKEDLHITRGRTAKNKPILRASGASGSSSKVSRYIQKKLRLEYADFVGLSYFQQGDIHQFMSSDKRAYFERWTSKLGVWALYEKEALSMRTDLQGQIEEALQQIDQMEGEAEKEEQVADAIKDIEARLAVHEKQMQSLQSKIERHKRELEDLTPDTSKDAREQALTLVRDKKRQAQRLRRQVDDLEQEREGTLQGVCPLLEIPCEPLRCKSVEQSERLTQKIQEAREALKTSKKELLDAEEKQRALSQENSFEASKRLLDALKGLQSELRVVRDQYKADHRRLAAGEARLKRIQSYKDRLAVLRGELPSLEKQLSHWAFLAFACSKRGIPSTLLGRELSDVQDRCNWILSCLESKKKILFRPFRVLSEYEKHCPRCGAGSWRSKKCVDCGMERPHKIAHDLTVSVVEGGSVRPFSNESGGAKVLLSFAVRLACGMFLANMTGVKMESIFLDEVFAMLDADNRQRLLTLVVDKLASSFGLEQQFVVSHHQDIVRAIDSLLVVKKHQGRSVAVWE